MLFGGSRVEYSSGESILAAHADQTLPPTPFPSAFSFSADDIGSGLVVVGIGRSLLPTGEPCATGGGCCRCWRTICAQNAAYDGAWLNHTQPPKRRVPRSGFL